MPERLRQRLPLLAVLLLTGCAGIGASVASSTPGVAAASASAIPSAASVVTPAPTAIPTPGATPVPDPAALDLEVTGCDGGVVLHWSASTHPDFHHYTALRSPEREIAPAYPPIAPAVDWGDTYATDPFVTSAVDGSILPSDTQWNYRVMAYDAAGRVVSASPVRTAQQIPAVDLGELRVTVDPGGVSRLAWDGYLGARDCFTSYRVLSGVGGTPTTVLRVVSDPTVTSIETDALHRSTPYQLRVDAVRSTTLGSIVVGRTDVTSLTIPEVVPARD